MQVVGQGSRLGAQEVAAGQSVEAGHDVAGKLGLLLLLVLFLADAGFLRTWASVVPPLVDAHPERAPAVVSSWTRTPEAFHWIRDAQANGDRFSNGNAPGSLWPAALVTASGPHFARTNFLRSLLLDPARPLDRRLAELHVILSQTDLEAPVHWILGSDAARAELATRSYEEGNQDPEVLRELGTSAFARRDFAEAAAYFGQAAEPGIGSRDSLLQAYALVLAGRSNAAQTLARQSGLATSPETSGAWRSILGLVESGDETVTGRPSN